jgi:pimeloyl-ACP methyl ester carboxylesterase
VSRTVSRDTRLPLVLLPALLCDDELYHAQIADLADVAQPMVLSAPAASLAEAARDVLRRVPERFALAGTSAGGNLALEVVATAPARVAGLWLMGCNPGAHPDPEEAGRFSARARAGEFDAVVEEMVALAVHAEGPRGREAADTLRRMAHRYGAEAFARVNDSLRTRPARWPTLDALRCPTLLLWGRQDQFAAVDRANAIAARVASAHLVVLEECGHLPTLEQSEAATRAARQWLRTIDEPGR